MTFHPYWPSILFFITFRMMTMQITSIYVNTQKLAATILFNLKRDKKIYNLMYNKLGPDEGQITKSLREKLLLKKRWF